MKTITKLLNRCCGQINKRLLSMSKIMLLLIVLFTSSIYAQDPAQYGTPFAGVPNRMDANIYQLNVREYNATSRTIAGVRANLQRVKDLGINVVYLMPFYPVSADPKGSDLSPYCIKDLKGVSPDLGTLTDLRGLVDDAHSKGMSVIIDFVVNQTAWDHPWITQHPDWYVKDASGKIVSPNAGTAGAPFLFTDVAQLDLNVVAAQDAMIDAMRYWIFAANVDGFRYDWADKSPQAFWTKALANLRGITSHKLLFLAEGSNEGSTSGCNTCGDNQPGAHYNQGFDYIFGTNFYWNVMKKVWNSGDPVKTLDAVTTGEYTGASSTQLVARFLSDHDDYNADGSPFSFLNGGRNAAMAAFVVTSYHRGVPFIYNGIEVGNTAPLPYPWRTGNINWSQDLTVYTEMQKILTFRNSSLALRQGQPTSYIDPANTNPDVIAFTKTINSEKVVVLVNVRNTNKTFTIPAGMAGTYSNAFNPGGASVSLASGSVVSLTPYQYLVYTNANVPVVAVTGVTTTPNSATIKVGLKTQLSASISPSNATNQGVTWTSSNTAVATVDTNGLVTGIATGTATITVKTNDGAKTSAVAITVNTASTFTVHFYKPASWSTAIKIYTWNSLPAGVLPDGAWPGVAMTTETEANVGWYSYTFTNVDSSNIIFDDGTNKTADLSRAGINGWYLGTTWSNTQPSLVAVTSVALTPTSVSLGLGATSQLTATVSPANANNQTVTWSSSNTAVASVSSTGLVTAGNMGTATITATTQDGGKIATSTVTVTAPTQTPYTTAIAIPGTVEVENFDNGGETVAYHDNDITNNGGQYRTTYGVDIEACSEGGYNIGWTNAGEWIEYTVNIAVSGTYNFDVRGASGDTGGSFRIEFGGVDKTGTLVVPGTGGYQNWASILKAGVSLSSGTQIMRIYMISGGYNLNKVIITNVTSVPVTAVTINPTAASLSVGSTQQLTTTILPANATNKTVTYSSNNTSVATVNTTGLVTAVSNGAATITVSTADGNKTSTCAITVNTATGIYYTIKNRWTNNYLYDAGTNVGYGTTVVNNNYKWQKIAVDASYFVLKNVATGEIMHIENQTGSVQSDGTDSSWWSAQWSADYIDGTWVRIRNRWKTTSIIHVENQTGAAQYSNIDNGWYSTQWQLETTTTTKLVASKNSVETENNLASVTVYPNPSIDNQFSVVLPELKVNDVVTVTVTDMNGKVLLATQITATSKINHNLSSGLYLLTIRSNELNVSKKLIVK